LKIISRVFEDREIEFEICYFAENPKFIDRFPDNRAIVVNANYPKLYGLLKILDLEKLYEFSDFVGKQLENVYETEKVYLYKNEFDIWSRCIVNKKSSDGSLQIFLLDRAETAQTGIRNLYESTNPNLLNSSSILTWVYTEDEFEKNEVIEIYFKNRVSKLPTILPPYFSSIYNAEISRINISKIQISEKAYSARVVYF
jgi:hypothetical protein